MWSGRFIELKGVAVSSAPIEEEASSAPTGRWDWLDERLDQAGEWLNPILVKEARQAMKSRQFSITFTLLLTFGLFWSFLGVSMQMPGIYYFPGGQQMLLGYFLILLVPMLLVVPFAAYRSLAAEREDGTYELLSITALNARKIVSGKLGSVLLQMLVYYSAIGPCVAFTYLLRGIDVLSIAFVMVITLLLSLMLSLIGLFLASVTRGRHWQLMISVVLILGCGIVAWGWGMLAGELMFDGGGLPVQEPDFWMALACAATAYLSYFWILFAATESLNDFPAENRSTRIRIAILVQLALYFGWYWFGLTMFEQNTTAPPEGFLGVALLFAAVHWMLYGSLMCGEFPRLSPRVARQLPSTFVGRLFTCWFWPGPATGYVFAATTFAIFTVTMVSISLNFGMADWTSAVWGGLVWGYLATFLAIGRLIMIAARRFAPRGFVLPVLINVLILLASVAVPLIFEAFSRDFRYSSEYSLLQASNWLWTFQEMMRGYRGPVNSLISDVVAPLVLLCGGVSYLIMLGMARGAVTERRRALPQRVQEDLAPPK